MALASVAAAGPASTASTASTARTLAGAPAAGDTWPMFGHDPRHSGVSSDTAIGASSAPGLARRWSRALPSSADQVSLAVAYDATLKKTLVYDVTYTGVVSAFNAVTGALVWRHAVGTDVFSSPAVYGGTVYFGDDNGTLEALNAATGAVQCTFTLPVAPPGAKPAHIFSSPVAGDVDGSGPTVFFGAQANDQPHGGRLWAVTGVGNTAGNCQPKWSYDSWPKEGSQGARTGVWDEPALTKNSNGTWAVVFGSSNPDDAVYALNAVTGSRMWRFQTVKAGTGQADQDVGAGPTISPPGGNGFAHGVVYVDGKDGIEYALNLLTGKKIWSFTLGPGSASALAVAEAPLTGTTLVVPYAGSVFALNAVTGARIWQVTPGGRIEASPAVSGGPGDQVLFVGDLNKHEYGLSLGNGSRLFNATTTGQIIASSAVADGMVYFTSGGTLYAYAPK